MFMFTKIDLIQYTAGKYLSYLVKDTGIEFSQNSCESKTPNKNFYILEITLKTRSKYCITEKILIDFREDTLNTLVDRLEKIFDDIKLYNYPSI